MRIGIGADHGGVSLKASIAATLLDLGHDVVDVGTHSTTSCDYPDIAHDVVGLLQREEVERGILICGTGLGMSMAAGKFPGVRAAVVSEEFSARMASAHNNANVLCLGERVVGPGLASALVEAWLATEFEGGRHGRRVGKIEGTWEDE